MTIATNMAGRGTDIQLGGNVEMRIRQELENVTDDAARTHQVEKIRGEVEVARQQVLTAGGLYIVGTERHESRRIDNQLRGRSGRQGDPGGSRFCMNPTAWRRASRPSPSTRGRMLQMRRAPQRLPAACPTPASCWTSSLNPLRSTI